jgi:hypothetical protein
MTMNGPFTPPSQQLLYPPTPQDFADALEQLNKGAQTQIRTPGALASNLLAEALLQYGRNRASQQQFSYAVGAPTTDLTSGDPDDSSQYSMAAGYPG